MPAFSRIFSQTPLGAASQRMNPDEKDTVMATRDKQVEILVPHP
jgi:hypothetical protein